MADEKAQRERRLLGWGIESRLIDAGQDLGRDLRLERGPAGLRLVTVEGMANLAQDLEVELTTRLGDDPFNVSFGFDGVNALADETLPVLVRERVRIAIIKLLARDPRVARIVDVKLEDGRLSEPDNSRRLDVRVVFETVAGSQASVVLGTGLIGTGLAAALAPR